LPNGRIAHLGKRLLRFGAIALIDAVTHCESTQQPDECASASTDCRSSPAASHCADPCSPGCTAERTDGSAR
jgi:hypothetical protein